jgi:hypothetical protein
MNRIALLTNPELTLIINLAFSKARKSKRELSSVMYFCSITGLRRPVLAAFNLDPGGLDAIWHNCSRRLLSLNKSE